MRYIALLLLSASACSTPSIREAEVEPYHDKGYYPEVTVWTKNLQIGDEITFKSFSFTHPYDGSKLDKQWFGLPVELFRPGVNREQIQITRDGKEMLLDFEVNVPDFQLEPYMRLGWCIDIDKRRELAGLDPIPDNPPPYLFAIDEVHYRLNNDVVDPELRCSPKSDCSSCGLNDDGKLYLGLVTNYGATVTAKANGVAVPIGPSEVPHLWLRRVIEIDAKNLIGDLNAAPLSLTHGHTVALEFTHTMQGFEPVKFESSLGVNYSAVLRAVKFDLFNPAPGSALEWFSTDNPTKTPRTVAYMMKPVIEVSLESGNRLYGQNELFGVASKGAAYAHEIDLVVHAKPTNLRRTGERCIYTMGDFVSNHKKVYDIEAVAYDLKGEEIGRKTFRGPKSFPCPDSISAGVGAEAYILGGPKAETITDWALSLSDPG